MTGHFQFKPGSATRKNLPNRVITAACAVCTVKKLDRPTMMTTTSTGQNTSMLDSQTTTAAALATALYDKARQTDHCFPVGRRGNRLALTGEGQAKQLSSNVSAGVAAPF